MLGTSFVLSKIFPMAPKLDYVEGQTVISRIALYHLEKMRSSFIDATTSKEHWDAVSFHVSNGGAIPLNLHPDASRPSYERRNSQDGDIDDPIWRQREASLNEYRVQAHRIYSTVGLYVAGFFLIGSFVISTYLVTSPFVKNHHIAATAVGRIFNVKVPAMTNEQMLIKAQVKNVKNASKGIFTKAKDWFLKKKDQEHEQEQEQKNSGDK